MLVDENKNIYITGYGLTSLKKYFSLTTTYSNKNIFTAVEYFKNKTNVVLKPKPSADIYSLGMILYETLTNNKAYRSETISEISKKLNEENFRPKIPPTANK